MTEKENYEPPAKLNKVDELDLIFSKSKQNVRPKKTDLGPPEVLRIIKREIVVLESTLKRPSCLEKLYKAIKSVLYKLKRVSVLRDRKKTNKV